MTEEEALAVLRGDDPMCAARAAAALWQHWHQSGDPRLDALLLEGVEAPPPEAEAPPDARLFRGSAEFGGEG